MRKIRFAENEFYHLYNRGVDKRTVFLSKDEYDRFVGYLYLMNDERNLRPANYFVGKRPEKIFTSYRRAPIVAIGAYCLMPNHFHILITPLVEGGISKFMHRLQTAYTMFFNEKHHRTGSLFEGTFRARHADEDDYLKYLFSYIHLNPAQLFDNDWEKASNPQLATLSLRVSEYQYSSVGEYITGKFTVTSPQHFPKYFAGKKDMKSFMDSWLKCKREFGEFSEKSV